MIARDTFHHFIVVALAWIHVSTLLSNEALWLQDIRQITFPEMGFEKAGEAYFSPDGQSILFQAVPVGQSHYQIYFMSLNDLTPQLVSTGYGACTCAFFRPDGQKIIFASSHSDPQLGSRPEKSNPTGSYVWDLTPYMNIYEANPDGSELKALTTGPAYHAECAYSHDGTSIVFASNETGSMNLYVMDADGSNQRQITHNTDCYNGGPFFSPDSSKIIYRADRETPHYLQIFVVDADGSNDTQLTDNGCVNWAPFWHPSGRFIAYTTSIHGHHRYEIYLLDLVTQQHYRITNHEGFDGLPVFNSTGDLLMWTSKRGPDQTCQLFIADFILPPQLKEFP